MNFSQYQSEALAFRLPSATPTYAILGLCAEAGEVADKVAKTIRDGTSNIVVRKQDIAKELGDVLWMIAVIADDMGFDLHDVAAMNLEKLHSRKARGVVQGSGDNR
jgi:NTP pyrophosphatase (non-canonical NTP hydrolase)